MATEADIIVGTSRLLKFVKRCMVAAGAEEKHAEILADILVTADYRGHQSHGLNRLDVYTEDVRLGICDGGGKTPVIVKETVSTALVDGNNLLGPVVGKFAMELAIQKAKNTGIGFVTAGGSNHFGIAGWYSSKALEHGMLGMAFTNSTPMLTPTRAKQQTFGTNPVSLSAPGKDGDSFELDMATTTAAFGKIELCRRKGIPTVRGWGVDRDGKDTTDPRKIEGLLPLGGMEETGGYKGYGLSMMVEVLCGILSGSTYGPFIRPWKQLDGRKADLSHCFIAIDTKVFTEGFENRLSTMMDHCRNLEPVNGENPVLVPGDPEKEHMGKCDKLGGIPYHPNQITFLNRLADSLQVKPLTPPEGVEDSREAPQSMLNSKY